MTTCPEGWIETPLKKVLTYLDERVQLEDMAEYITITVKRRHGGLEAREKLLGHQIKTKKQFRLIPGAFIISRVQCWHQAFAIVPDDIPGNMIASTNYDQFAISSDVDPRFFWWLAHSPSFAETVRNSAVGVVIEKMVFDREAWLEKTIFLPALDEQRRIVARIETLAAKTEQAWTLRKNTIEETQSLVSTKLARVFSTLVERYGSRELSELILDAGYGTSTRCDYQKLEGSVAVLRIPNVASEHIVFENMKYAILDDAQLKRVLVNEGEILLVRTNGSLDLVGRSAVVPALEEPTAFASYLIRLKCDCQVVTPKYMQLMLKHLRISGRLIDFARTTAGQYNVSLGRLRAAKIPVPPITEQRHVNDSLDDLQAKANDLEHLQAETATELDALLPSILDKAFKGEL